MGGWEGRMGVEEREGRGWRGEGTREEGWREVG